MACNCDKRRAAITRAATAIKRGDVKTIVNSAAFVSRTLAQDIRSGALKSAASANLARLRNNCGRR